MVPSNLRLRVALGFFALIFPASIVSAANSFSNSLTGFHGRFDPTSYGECGGSRGFLIFQMTVSATTPRQQRLYIKCSSIPAEPILASDSP